MRSNAWKKWQEDLLIKWYPHTVLRKNLPKKLSKKMPCIHIRATKLGIKSFYHFSKKEIAIIKKRYPNEGPSESLAYDLNRSRGSIRKIAGRLKFKVKKGHIFRNYSGKNCKTYTGYEGITGAYIAQMRRNARVRNRKFDLNPKYLWQLYEKQNRKCAISGLYIDFIVNSNNRAALDRINPSKDYLKGNVQWVYNKINYMKWDLKQQDFIRLCKIITKYNNKI